MIVSHRYKFIFIKTAKTAGTSVEIALSKYLGADDIITPISPEDEALRRALGHRGPQNYVLPYARWNFAAWARYALFGRPFGFYNHAPAAFIRQHVGAAVWNDYFKFCFERNPWDKAVSLYYYRNQHEPRPSISQFLASKEPGNIPGRSLYCIDDQVVVDRIYRYELINQEMVEIAERLGLPEVPTLPHAKSKQRNDKRSYREILGANDRERIRQLFAPEIAALGYEW